MKIIVGVDGSPASNRAVEWCAAHAEGLGAEIVAVHSIEMPVYAASGFGAVPLPVPSEPDREELQHVIETGWCSAIGKAGVPCRVVLMDGPPASSIIAFAEREDAELVVTGRRGRGGFAELLLGSVSHHLSLHLNRPLLIVP